MIDQNSTAERIVEDASSYKEVAINDHKIKFCLKFAKNKTVLDLGCVQHDPIQYQSKYWLHKALKTTSKSLIGLDYDKDGVEFLKEIGFDIVCGDAQNFDLKRKFDVIIAGDLIEHLANFEGFLLSCKKHMNADSRLIISTPNPWYWKYIVKSIMSYEVYNNPEHTCWLCPSTLRQLVNRYGFDISEIKFGSRYKSDRFMPLPRGIKHTSFHAEILLTENNQ